MDLQTSGHPFIAATCLAISLITGFFASIVGNIDIIVRIGAGTIAMASGFMAIRYYYHATRKVIKESQNQ